MTPTPEFVRAHRRGIPVWLDVTSGDWFPIIAGADASTDDEGADDGQADDGQQDGTGDDAGSDDGDDDGRQADDDATRLKAALEKERKARRAAEKRARDAERNAKPKPDKPEAKPETGDDPAARVTDKLRRANLKAALADEGITGQQAKAAMRLLDGVEYDTDDEPTNLADALEAAEALYGKATVRGQAKPKAPAADGGAGSGSGDGQGPRLTADELAYAKEFGMTPEEYAAHKSTTPPPPAKK